MGLKERIDEIRIIDAHVHCVDPYCWMTYVGSFPFGFRLEKPGPTTLLNKRKSYIKGYQALYDFPYDDLTPENEAWLDETWKKTIDLEAEYDMKAFDQAGVEMGIEMCLSGPELPPGLPEDRFKMAVLIDGFLIPLDNTDVGQNERAKQFVTMGIYYPGTLVEKYQPADFDAYLKMISDTFDELKAQGVVAFKMNYPYWRDIQIDVVDYEDALPVYEQKDNSPVAYKKLQDYIMRFMTAKAAEIGLPIQIHTGGIGISQQLYRTDPIYLEDLLWLPECKKAKIVLLHAAYPYCKKAGYMAQRKVNAPEIYIDFSMMVHCLPGAPDSVVPILRDFILEGLEDRLMYGSDGNNPMTTWLGAYDGREAVYQTVKGLCEDGYIDEEHAYVIAKKLLRDNAIALYQL